MKSTTVVVYDANETTLLGKSWAAYASTFKHSFGVRTWSDVKGVLRETMPLGQRDLQVWGHGSPGSAWLGSSRADPSAEWWAECASVWFRSCSVMNGLSGRRFTAEIARRTDVAGHLGVIGTWGMQSRLVGVRRGDEPWWAVAGVSAKERSAPWVPRTVTALQRSLPEWAFTPAHG